MKRKVVTMLMAVLLFGCVDAFAQRQDFVPWSMTANVGDTITVNVDIEPAFPDDQILWHRFITYLPPGLEFVDAAPGDAYKAANPDKEWEIFVNDQILPTFVVFLNSSTGTGVVPWSGTSLVLRFLVHDQGVMPFYQWGICANHVGGHRPDGSPFQYCDDCTGSGCLIQGHSFVLSLAGGGKGGGSGLEGRRVEEASFELIKQLYR